MNISNYNSRIILFLLLLLFASCDKKEDDSLTISVSVNNISYDKATVSWTGINIGETVIYKILLNNVIIEESFRDKAYTFNNLTENTKYSGTIFALTNNGEETFKDFSFSTLRNSNLVKHITITKQSEIDNFYYTGVLNLIIDGEEITDLSGLNTLTQLHNALTIKNTSLETLEGLENIEYVGPHIYLPFISIENNKKLKNISSLRKISKEAKSISLKDNINLKNLEGLEPTSGVLRELFIENSPIDDLTVFLDLIELQYLYVFKTNIVNFEGLNPLTKILQLSIQNNSNLESLSGLENLIDSFGLRIYIKNNQKLIDFCGIRNLMENNNIQHEFINDSMSIYHFGIEGNGYNPTENDLRSDMCKQ